ncbi:MAG: hypothetical protein ABEJ34_06290 [Haloferacaceae archaeon]
MFASTRGRTARLVLAVTVVLAASLASGAAPVVAGDRDAVSPVAQVETDRPGGASNNTTTIHQNPAEVAPERTAPELQAYLLAQMSGTLGASVDNLSRRDYDRAAALLDRQYAANLSRYRAVAAELDEEEQAAIYERLGVVQGAVIEDARTAERLARQYRAAERNGSDARARRLARRLLNRSRAISTNTTRLVQTYERAGNRTGVDYSAEIAQLERIQRRVTAAAAQVRAREFDSTALSVRVNRTTAAFTAPARVTGRLTAGNATPVANRSITLRAGEQRHAVETNASGAFAFVYRPVLAPANASTLTVRYLPAETSVYLPANASVPLQIRQTEATLTDVSATSPVGFGETLRVRGAVTVDGRRVAGLPLRVLVNETQFATTTPGPNGTFRARATVPAAIPAGTRQLAVRGPPDRAVRLDATRPLTVAETPTTLTGSVARRTESRAVVTGRFTTADGRALANRTLRVTVGRRDRTVETDANGSYVVRVDLTLGRLDTPRDQVRVAYREAPSNLERTSVVVPIPPRPPSTSSRDLDDLTLVGLLRAVVFSEATLGLVAILASAGLVGATVRLYRRRRDDPSADPDPADDPSADPDPADAASAGESLPDDPPDPTHPYAAALDDARRALSAGATDAAVRGSYGVVWAILRDLVDAETPTHWELYAAVSETGHVPAAPLRRLTETYEQTAYAATPVGDAAARDALVDADAVLAGLDPDALPDEFDPDPDDRPPGHGAATGAGDE